MIEQVLKIPMTDIARPIVAETAEKAGQGLTSGYEENLGKLHPFVLGGENRVWRAGLLMLRI